MKRLPYLVLVLVAILSVAAEKGGVVGSYAFGGEPQKPDLAKVLVEKALESLTFDDFQLRERVVRHLSDQGLEVAAKLVEHAQDESSPLRLKARYMLRRTFWDLAPKVLKEYDSSDPAVQSKAREVFLVMVSFCPLKGPRFDSRRKPGLIYERLGRYDLALKAHRGWEPGTYARLRAKRAEDLIRCLRKLDRPDKVIKLCWRQLRQQRKDPSPSPVPFVLALVELYEAQGRLDELVKDIKQSDVTRESVKVALEYVDIRRDFQAGDYQKVLPHLSSGRLSQPSDVELADWRDWQPGVVAKGFAEMGGEAVPILVEHLRKQKGHGIWHTLWLFQALRMTNSPKIVEPVIEVAAREHAYGFIVSEILQQFPECATRHLAALLEDENSRLSAAREQVEDPFENFDSEENSRIDDRDVWLVERTLKNRRFAVRELAHLGTSEAVTTLIKHMPSEEKADPATIAFAERCVWALWRLTGESLGMETWPRERIAEEAKDCWKEWWSQRRGRFQPKCAAWWQTPEAAPLLVKALDSPLLSAQWHTRNQGRVLMKAVDLPFLTADATRDLMALEHPVLLTLLQRPQGTLTEKEQNSWASCRLTIAKTWMRFDPAPTVPVIIECADTWQTGVPLLLTCLTRQEFGRDEAAWRAWWQANKDKVELEIRERWW